MQAMVGELGEPIMSSSLILPGQTAAMANPENIREKLEHDVDLVIDGGTGTFEPSTVVDWHEARLKIIRVGAGDISFLEN